MITSVSEIKSKNESTSVIFDCISFGTPKPNINWYYQNYLIIQNSTVNGKFSSKYVFFYNGSLLIKDLKSQDSGIYSCQALNLDKFNSVFVNHTLEGKTFLLV